MELLLPILLVALVVGAIAFSFYAKAQRQKLFRQIATRMGCRYHEKDPFGIGRRHESGFPTLRQGSNRYAYNVIDGEWEGYAVRIFDHHHETYSHNKNGRQTHHHHRTFVLVEHDMHMGHLDVRPEGMFDKLKAAFGFDDIDFESAEFSRKWHVGAKDRKFAYDVFNPKMLEYFLTLRGFKLSTNGEWGLYRFGSGTMNALEIKRTLRGVDGFVGRVPRFVKKDREQL